VTQSDTISNLFREALKFEVNRLLEVGVRKANIEIEIFTYVKSCTRKDIERVNLMDQKKKITLQAQHWHYTCGDGCCDDYGERLYVNGEELEKVDIYYNAHGAIEEILKHLGYEVEWDELEDDRMDSRMDIDLSDWDDK
jgi:hypothetical protein